MIESAVAYNIVIIGGDLMDSMVIPVVLLVIQQQLVHNTGYAGILGEYRSDGVSAPFLIRITIDIQIMATTTSAPVNVAAFRNSKRISCCLHMSPSRSTSGSCICLVCPAWKRFVVHCCFFLSWQDFLFHLF